MIKHTTIAIKQPCNALGWVGSSLIDWSRNVVYYNPHNKGNHRNKYSYGNRFNGVKSINDGEYVVIYEKLGTKGLILKNGTLIREINRSYYCADVYEYPVAVFKGPEGEVLIAHCPEDYNQIDIEEIETGNSLTNSGQRKPVDVFHSRLEVSPNGQYLISAGWVWHPYDVLAVFDLKKVFSDPNTLDAHTLGPHVGAEVSCARFMTDSRLLVSTSDEEPLDDEADQVLPPNYVGAYNLEIEKFDHMWKQPVPMGNLMPIDGQNAWDFLGYPKVVSLVTGEEIAHVKTVDSGMQNSSIIHHHKNLPAIAVSEDRTKAAVASGDQIAILEWKTST